ncbi:MAG: 50S ribosomal protein L25/general stress protein Ctc [Gammaproteobacteria bacterium]|nr:50S ribosomal protein L25/general stress protein Ctc [Gammaproteobacteria bacterium]
MKISFEVAAEPRSEQGKSVSRRLRRAGKVPAILYGGHAEPRALALDHQRLRLMVGDERFYSSIISVNVGAERQPAIVKDVQMHPAKNAVLHVDLQRVLENEKIRLHVPIHFRNETTAPGVKTQGGVVSHHLADVEVVCLPKDLPEFFVADLARLNLNETLYLADLPVAADVTISELALGHNLAVVSIHSPRAAEPEPTAEAAATTEAAAAPAAAGEARKDEAKKEEPRKDAGKK